MLATPLDVRGTLREVDPELVRHVAGSTGLPGRWPPAWWPTSSPTTRETTEEFVRRRHRELQARDRRNAEIWTVIADELAHRPVAPGAVSERRLRRIVYG